MPELIRVRFTGGIADTGQLHYYEYSRSQYARARFLATIENFRRSGHVAERITLSSNVEIIVRTPQEGSFVEDVLIPVLQQGVAAAVSAPLSSLISYVWHMMINRPETTDTAVREFADVRLAEMNANVNIERERTQQIEAQMDALRAVADGARANTADALALARYALESNNAAIARLEYPRAQISSMIDGLEAEQQREEEFSEHRGALEQIDEDTLNRLTSRLRPMVPEMALPLRRSATSMSMSHGERGTTYANLDRSTVSEIEGRTTEPHETVVIVQVRSYDRVSGVGKVTSDAFNRPLNFLVPLRDRTRLRDEILDAMREDAVAMVCRRVLDKSGLPTSLILIGFADPEDALDEGVFA